MNALEMTDNELIFLKSYTKVGVIKVLWGCVCENAS